MKPATARRLRGGFAVVCVVNFSAALLVPPAPGEGEPGPDRPEAKAITSGPKHHFFGYYDKCPWDSTGRYVLANEIGFCDRQPKPGEPLTVGMVDLQDGNKYTPLDTTDAWCWQQGCMLQWLGSAPDREVIYNAVDADKGRYVSVIRDVRTGKTRRLPLPIYYVSRDGKQALSLNFDRLNRLRPGYGYMALPERNADAAAPADMGVYWMDTATGEHKLIVSLDRLSKSAPKPSFEGAQHWVNHLQFNPSATRLLFLHRWARPGKQWETRLYTVDPDGGNLTLVIDTGMVSHFDWRDDDSILAWSRTGEHGDAFYVFDARTGKADLFGGDILKRDGHCSYSPDREWVLNDTYPDAERLQTLMLIRVDDRKRFDLGQFYLPPELAGPFRCDLHPRWNRDGTKVCIDSAHGPTRQMYVLDVGDLTKKQPK